MQGTTDGEFLGFAFSFIQPRLEAKEATNLEMPTGTDKTDFYLVKSPGKGPPKKTEHFQTKITLVQSSTIKHVPYS